MMNNNVWLISMVTMVTMLLTCCKEHGRNPLDEEVVEVKISPRVIDYAPGYSQFIAERFVNCHTKEEILDECTQILSSDEGNITLGGFGGSLVLDLGSKVRAKDYTFRFKGNGFDDLYSLVSASYDGEAWMPLNSLKEIQHVDFSYVKNTSYSYYSWQIDTVKNCRKVGVKEICTTEYHYQWDTTAIWSKVVDGVVMDIKPNSSNKPLVYVSAHSGPYFNDLLSLPSGILPKTSETLVDTFVVKRDVRYLKFQNVFDSISPIVGEFSPEIAGISILLK